MEYSITHNQQNHRFETIVDAHMAYVEYVPFEKGIRMTHTIVPQPIEGRGIAAALVKATLEFALREKIKVVPICSYVVAYLKRHTEYETLLQ